MMGTRVTSEMVRQGESIPASGQPGTKAGVTGDKHCWNN